MIVDAYMDFVKVQKGEDGSATYVWIRYSDVADPTESDLLTSPSDYIGIYTGPSSTAPTNPDDYNWYKIKGESIEGPPGENGSPTYIHIKYSNDGGDTFTDGNGTTPGEYMGVLVDLNEVASNTPSDYIWQYVKGDPGTGYTVYLSNENHSFSADGDGVVQASSIEFKVCAWKETELIASTVTLPENIPTGMTVTLRENTNGTLAPIIKIDVDETFTETEGTLEFDISCGDIQVTKIFSYNVIRGGKDGDGVESSDVAYQVSDNGNTPPDGEWLEEIPEIPSGMYLWTRTITHYKSGMDIASYSVSYQGVDGTDGKDGIDGTDGRGVANVVNYYLATSMVGGVTIETEGWTTTFQDVTEEKRYLWTYEEIQYDDDSPSSTTDPFILSVYTTDGKDGRSIESITEYYLVSDSATDVTVDTPGWTTEFQHTTEELIYLWNYEVITYDDGSEPTVSKVRMIGTRGEPGTDGVGIVKTEITYQAGSSGIDIPTGEWLTTIPELESGQFLWVRTITTYSNDTTSTTYTVSRNGEDGRDGRAYGIDVSAPFLLANFLHDGFQPATVTFTPYYQEGEDGVKSGFTCDIEFQYSINGIDWISMGRVSNVTSRTLNTDINVLNGLDRKAKHVKCIVYTNGGENPFVETSILIRDNTDENELLFVQGTNSILIQGSKLVAGSVLTDALAANSVTASKIAAHSITAEHITTNDIVGTNGWINLHDGEFNFGSKLIWNGSQLTVKGHIVATSGQIADFTISGDALYSNSKSYFGETSTGVYLGSDGIMLGDSFSVTASGSMMATEGNIGGWNINTYGIMHTQTIDGAWTPEGEKSGYTELGTYIYPGSVGLEDTENGERVAGGTIIWSHVIPYDASGTEYAENGKRSRTGFVIEADGSFAFGAYYREKGNIKFHVKDYSTNQTGSFDVNCEHVDFNIDRMYMSPGGYTDASIEGAIASLGTTPANRCVLLIESSGRIVYDESLHSGYIRGLKDKIDTIDAKLSSITGEGSTGNSFKITANTITLTANDAMYLKIPDANPAYGNVLFATDTGRLYRAQGIGVNEIGKLSGLEVNVQSHFDAIDAQLKNIGKVEDLYFESAQVATTFQDEDTGNYGVIPSVTQKYVLGSPNYRWNKVFSNELRAYSSLTVDGTFTLNSVNVGTKLNSMLTKDTADDYYATKSHSHTDLSNKISDLEDEIDNIGSSSGGMPTSLYYTNGTEVVETYRDNNTLNYGLIPIQSAKSVLGIPSKRWNKLFLTSSSSIDSSSDQRLKTMISDIDERYEKIFMGLRPVTYAWRDTEVDSKIHCGFIAQQVNEIIQKNNLTMDSFAFVNHYYFDEEVDGLTDQWSLAYSELHGLEVHMIQKAIHRIESLEEENTTLKNQIQSILSKLNITTESLEGIE